MYFVYSLALGLAALLLLPYWLTKGLRQGDYFSHLRQRLGWSFPSLTHSPAQSRGAIWIHAVSVGEVLSAVTLARRLKTMYPDRALAISTTTITGQAVARERLPFADAVFYFPLDWNFCVRRALNAVQPVVVIILETEIWPNFLRQAHRRGIPVLFVSGRVSARSHARFQKYVRPFGFFLRPFLKSALAHAAGFLMQSGADAARVRALGAPSERVSVNGNLKYDLEQPLSTPLAEWLEKEAQRAGRSPLIVAGSVVATEEPLALLAFGVVQGEYPRALLVLAPRKPARFEAAAEFIEESRRKWVRRSHLPIPLNTEFGRRQSSVHTNGARIPEDAAVLLLDSIGELASLYRLADGILIGGSLVPAGGHNILEPAAFGKIAVFGPSMENFAEIASRFVAAEAALQVGSPEDVGVAWIQLLRDPKRSQRMGENARALIETSRGVTDRVLAEVDKHVARASARGSK